MAVHPDEWALYLVTWPYTFRWVEVGVELLDTRASAFDMLPGNLTEQVASERTFTVSPQLQFADVSASAGEVTRKIVLTRLHPVITYTGSVRRVSPGATPSPPRAPWRRGRACPPPSCRYRPG